MPHVRVNDCDLYLEDEGSGPPVVFIHGLWCSGRFFAEQLPFFAERHRAVVVDLRSHGRSEATQTGNTVAQHARDVHALLEALELRDAVLVGWSMGFLVVLDYLRQFGAERVRAVVDVDQSPTDLKWPDWPYGLLDLSELHAFHTGAQEDPEATARHFVPLLFAEPPPPELEERLVAEVLQVPPAQAAVILVDQTLVDYRDMLGEITVPALLCLGRGEKLVPVAAGEWMRERLPDATLEIFERSDHCPFLEEAERFNRVLDEWIRSLP